MKLGILDAVPPKYYLAGEPSDPNKFRRLFAAIGVERGLPHYNVTVDEFPTSVDDCDAYLITGSPVSVYDDLPWIADLENFIRHSFEAKTPLIGICFGHQIIAQALGGTVQKAKQGWTLGLHNLETFQPKPWMTPQQSTYSLYFVNKDQVVALPPNAEWIAQTENCPYAMFTIDDRVLGLQAHPEQSVTSMLAFTEYLKQQLPAGLYQQALASFEAGEPHANLFGRWVWQFAESALNSAYGTENTCEQNTPDWSHNLSSK